MTNLIAFRCPTCGANLQIAGDANRFSCDHCGNTYLLAEQAQKLPITEREHPQPLTTYTRQLGQWLKVGDYEICVHQLFEERAHNERLIYVNVQYRNNNNDGLKYRRSQWIIYDAEGYSYDPESKSSYFEPKDRPPLSERVIAPGMQARGWVVFKLPKKCKPTQLQFLSGYMSRQTAEFALKQP